MEPRPSIRRLFPRATLLVNLASLALAGACRAQMGDYGWRFGAGPAAGFTYSLRENSSAAPGAGQTASPYDWNMNGAGWKYFLEYSRPSGFYISADRGTWNGYLDDGTPAMREDFSLSLVFPFASNGEHGLVVGGSGYSVKRLQNGQWNSLASFGLPTLGYSYAHNYNRPGFSFSFKVTSSSLLFVWLVSHNVNAPAKTMEYDSRSMPVAVDIQLTLLYKFDSFPATVYAGGKYAYSLRTLNLDQPASGSVADKMTSLEVFLAIILRLGHIFHNTR